MAAATIGWRPMVRAALTSGTVMAAGDAMCQTIRHRFAGKRDIKIDLAQSARFGLVGLTLHGPFFFYGFRWLDTAFGTNATLRKAVVKTLTGQFTLFPAYTAAFFTYMGLLEGLSLPECGEKVKKTVPATFVTGSVFWPAVNVLNFMMVPPAGRVVYVNVAGLFWNAWLS